MKSNRNNLFIFVCRRPVTTIRTLLCCVSMLDHLMRISLLKLLTVNGNLVISVDFDANFTITSSNYGSILSGIDTDDRKQCGYLQWHKVHCMCLLIIAPINNLCIYINKLKRKIQKLLFFIYFFAAHYNLVQWHK